MDEKSTQVKSDLEQKVIKKCKVGASDRSLSFLKMFARSYHVEFSLPSELNSTCVN